MQEVQPGVSCRSCCSSNSFNVQIDLSPECGYWKKWVFEMHGGAGMLGTLELLVHCYLLYWILGDMRGNVSPWTVLQLFSTSSAKCRTVQQLFSKCSACSANVIICVSKCSATKIGANNSSVNVQQMFRLLFSWGYVSPWIGTPNGMGMNLHMLGCVCVCVAC